MSATLSDASTSNTAVAEPELIGRPVHRLRVDAHPDDDGVGAENRVTVSDQHFPAADLNITVPASPA